MGQISLKLGGREFLVDSEKLAERLAPVIEQKLGEAEGKYGMLRQAVKGVVSMAFGMMGIHNQSGEDNLVFAAKYAARAALDGLETIGLELDGEEVKKDE